MKNYFTHPWIPHRFLEQSLLLSLKMDWSETRLRSPDRSLHCSSFASPLQASLLAGAVVREHFNDAFNWPKFSFRFPVSSALLSLLLLLSRFSRVRLCATPQTAAHQAPVPGILQARTLNSFSSAWKWKVKVKLLSRVQLLATPMDCSLPGSSVHATCQIQVAGRNYGL